jgi:hypothetical protein
MNWNWIVTASYLLDETDNKILVFIKIVSATKPSSVPVLYFIKAVTWCYYNNITLIYTCNK